MGESILNKQNYGMNEEDTPYMMAVWKLLQAYTTAGAFTFTAPDLYGDGRSYKIGVLIIGGGGSGAAVCYNSSRAVGGGASGRSLSFTMEVTPGSTYNGVVGDGGNSAVATGYNVVTAGLNGYSSSFAGKTASGGEGGHGSGMIRQGGQNTLPYSSSTVPPFGGVVYVHPTAEASTHIPNECYNPFEYKRMLGAGGEANNNPYNIGGRDPVTNLGASDGLYSETGSVTSSDATDAGCGSGGAFVRTNSSLFTAKSGKAGNGAVKIYIPEVIA